MNTFAKIFLILLSISIVSATHAQKLTEYEKKLDNLFYEANSYIVSYSKCLTGFYETVSKGKAINRYGQNGCDHETPWDLAHINDSLFYWTVSRNNPEIFAAFEQLNKVCKQVVIDMKLERLDEPKLSEHFILFEKACLTLNNTTEPLRSRWRNEAMRLLPKEIANYMMEEYNRFRDLRHSLRGTLAVNFPEELLRQDLKNSDSLMVLLEVKASGDSKLHLSMPTIEGFQNNKKYYLNELNYKNRSLADYKNDFYYQIHNHYNNGILQMLRVHYNMPHSIYIPFLPFNNTKAETAPTPTFQYKSLNNKLYEGNIAHWNFKDADALGELTEALNRATAQTNQNTDALYDLKTDMERRIAGKTRILQIIHKFSLDIGDLQGALGRLKLNKNEAFPLISEQTTNVIALLDDTRVIYELLQTAVDKKEKTDNDFSAEEKLLEQYRNLITDLEKQVQVLNKNINKANSTQLNGQDSWSKSSRALLGYCEELRAEIEMSEQKALKEGVKDNYDYSKIEKAYADLLEREIPMMTGIKKLGSGHGKCPYGIFERMLENGMAQHRGVKKFSDSSSVPFKQGCCDGYSNMVRHYNEALGTYNKFSLQGAERETDFAKYDHPTPVVNPLLLAKVQQLPDMKIKAVPPPAPIPVPIPVPEPKADTVVTPENPQNKAEMNKAYIERCKPNNIIFLIDVSASMNEEKKLTHFKEDLKSIAVLMRPEDMISIVSFQGKATLELKQTTVTNHKKWEKAIEQLSGDGGTRFNEGLTIAYDYMEKIANEGYNNRIVLITDGAFTVNNESRIMIQRAAQTRSIAFSALVYHPHGKVYPEVLDLTAISKGNYTKVTERESGAAALFGEFSVLK